MPDKTDIEYFHVVEKYRRLFSQISDEQKEIPIMWKNIQAINYLEGHRERITKHYNAQIKEIDEMMAKHKEWIIQEAKNVNDKGKL